MNLFHATMLHLPLNALVVPVSVTLPNISGYIDSGHCSFCHMPKMSILLDTVENAATQVSVYS
jgi:hypothetical protein